MVWDTSKKASKIWIILGFIGIGQLIALIYSLVSKNDKDRILGVLFILGWLGDIIIYFLEKDKDKYIASMALYLLIGEIVVIIVAVLLFSAGLFSTSVLAPTASVSVSSVGFSPFSVSAAVCNSNGLTVSFSTGSLPNGASSATIISSSYSSGSGITPTSGTLIPSTSIISSGSSFNLVSSTASCKSGAAFSASGVLTYEISYNGLTTTYNATGTIAGTGS
ncbi:hypothetical protein M1494_00700 [Candidatus Parvarchaeota archaeon]|nr:hypothetical protein [Candidatus Parvarchaeota archaeon]